MRFTENGPDVPDDLLVARDQGNVLFFCGAGVSRHKAGLSDFLKLAGDVMDDLGSLTGSQARRLYDAANTQLPSGGKSYVPVDRMFSSLDLEFDPREVRDAVARALKPAQGVDLEAHRTMIDLSRGADGRPRLITTNFDRLFEACDPQLKSSGPPHLPIPERAADFEGIIHIHGRTNEDYSGISADDVVLSSSDFGKAYLSDGWATHYIRRLMNRFKIVFVGYSADDPPVQYLLEALREEQSPVTNIYAFQSGDEIDAREQWVQKGVFPIAFGNDFGNLWGTLGAWAARARDVDGWYQDTINQAAAGPSGASLFFRGRIAHLASTTEGMAKLTRLKPAIPSTWLYTFDPRVRYLEPRREDIYNPGSPLFDPFDHFGLDRDVAPPPWRDDDHFQRREVPDNAWSAFEATRRDLGATTEREIGTVLGHGAMAQRQWMLGLMALTRLEEAPALWWAAGQRNVHPSLLQVLENELRYRHRPDDAKFGKYWRYLLQSWKRRPGEPDQAALEIGRRAKKEGWSPALIREAVALSWPTITVGRRYSAVPPLEIGADPSTFMSLDVDYPKIHRAFDFDEPSLPLVVAVWRALLVEAEQMEVEIDAYLSLDTTRPDDGQRLGEDQYGLTGPLVTFTHLMERFARSNPAAAAMEARTWSQHPGLVFERLTIWAAGRADLTTIEEAGDVFANMKDNTFWSDEHERDLYCAIRDRWPDLSEAAKRSVETRLLKSSIPYLEGSDVNDAAARGATARLSAIQWFVDHGVTFSFDVTGEKARLRELAPNWTEESTEWTAQPRTSGVYSIHTDTDANGILDIPPDQLLPIQTPKRGLRDRVEHDPFAGYSATRPEKAVEALRSGMARNVENIWSWWSTFLRSTREIETSSELDAQVVTLLVSFSTDDLAKLWHPLVDWFAHRATAFEERGGGLFDLVWDKVVETAVVQPSGYQQKPRRDWSFEALNSVVGRLTLALLEIKLPKDPPGVPAAWLARLTKLLHLPGDHARHALYLIARQSGWFHHWQPAWWDAELLPKSADQGADGDAFWSGFAGLQRAPDPILFGKVKADLAQRVRKGEREERSLIAHMLNAWGRPGADQQVSSTELRDILVLGDDEVRQAMLQNLSNWASQDQQWADLVIPFLTTVWPKQRTAKTPQMSSALFLFASTLPKQFASIIELVTPRLVPLSRGHNIQLQCEVTKLDAAGVEALLVALERLLPDDRFEWPFGAKHLVDAMVKAGVAQGGRFEELRRRSDERDF